MNVLARTSQLSPLDSTSARLDVTGTGFDTFVWSASGDWIGDVEEKTVGLPVDPFTRSAAGIELTSSDLLDLGRVPTSSLVEFVITYTLETSASLSSQNGLFAMADFSGTGGFEFQALDENGLPFTDFTVNAVPEPTSLLALSSGLMIDIFRRRRHHQARLNTITRNQA